MTCAASLLPSAHQASSIRRPRPSGSSCGAVSCDSNQNSSTPAAFEATSKRRKGFPSEARVKRGDRVVRGNKELLEKLGRNDLCPCQSGRRFQELLYAPRLHGRFRAGLLLSENDCVVFLTTVVVAKGHSRGAVSAEKRLALAAPAERPRATGQGHRYSDANGSKCRDAVRLIRGNDAGEIRPPFSGARDGDAYRPDPSQEAPSSATTA
jgi:SEC-C motif